MINQKVFAIVIASIMILGSMPLGFSEPLHIQLEQGIETNELQCNNPDHVLVQRTNGAPACVTEKTALKTGWEIINQSTVHQITYEFPLSSKDYPTHGNSESGVWLADFDVTISNLPKIGETAEIVVTVTNESPYPLNELYPDATIEIQITDNFEFIDVPEDKIVTGKDQRYLYYKEHLSLDIDETQTLSATVKAVKTGFGSLGGIATQEYSYKPSVFVDEDQTLLREDYYKINPRSLEPVQEFDDTPIPGPEPEPAPPGEEENKTENSVETTEEELREDLRNDGATEEEIEEIIRKAFPDSNVSTQFFLSSPMLVLGVDDIQREGVDYEPPRGTWPKNTVEIPSQVTLNEPFEASFTWQYFILDKNDIKLYATQLGYFNKHAVDTIVINLPGNIEFVNYAELGYIIAFEKVGQDDYHWITYEKKISFNTELNTDRYTLKVTEPFTNYHQIMIHTINTISQPALYAVSDDDTVTFSTVKSGFDNPRKIDCTERCQYWKDNVQDDVQFDYLNKFIELNDMKYMEKSDLQGNFYNYYYHNENVTLQDYLINEQFNLVSPLSTFAIEPVQVNKLDEAITLVDEKLAKSEIESEHYLPLDVDLIAEMLRDMIEKGIDPADMIEVIESYDFPDWFVDELLEKYPELNTQDMN